MYFDLFNNNYKKEDIYKFNYWYINKYDLELIKKHILNLKYFNFDTNNLIDNILQNKNFENNKQILINTEYEQDFDQIIKLMNEYSSLEYIKNHNIINIFFKNYFNLNIDKIYYIIDKNKNKDDLLSLNNNINEYKINAEIFLQDEKLSFENIKKTLLNNCKNEKLNYILILNDSFLFDKNVIDFIINKNLKIHIPNIFTEFYLDYFFEENNYRYNDNIIHISSYNKNGNSIINLNNNNFKYYGLYPSLKHNLNPKKNDLIYKRNYMKNKYKFQTLMINLDRRKDRLDNFFKNYGNIYPNVLKFSAVDGKNFNFNQFKNILDISNYNQYNLIKNTYASHNNLKGALGCIMSHYLIWNIIANNNNLLDNDYILVLEDDIYLSKDFNLKLNNLLEYIHFDNEWDVVFLGFSDYHNTNDKKINDMLIQFSGDKRLRGGGTFSYFIRKKAAKKYLQFANKYKIQQPIDWFMIELFKYMTVYKCEPEIIHSQIANNNLNIDSDIQNLKDQFLFE